MVSAWLRHSSGGVDWAASIAIEYRDGRPSERFEVSPGQVDWDEPGSEAVHRGVNVGDQEYEEITVFFLDHPEAAPQPTDEPA